MSLAGISTPVRACAAACERLEASGASPPDRVRPAADQTSNMHTTERQPDRFAVASR